MTYFIAGLLISAVHAFTIKNTAHGRPALSSMTVFVSTTLSMLVLVSIIKSISGTMPILLYALGMAAGNFVAVSYNK